MNEEMKDFAEELQELLRKGQKVLNKMGQSMGQRRGYAGRGNMGYRDDENWGNMNERNFMGGMGYDPRFM